ncbi:sugar ABC transporter permease [Paenibacillus sp. HWE-109]|uniref:carbohydrate ABC transporter permease n=1 Tax=Paenibacillus sp. HWE-109 TaxID=1306526 RepID=UPI001EE0005A|nr:sugar ABC transporter permease [Paenibacillus sp. HWE-109]UKS28314.1 sugar ABC transporter permease [Paenibacillus sp. HWE-109]
MSHYESKENAAVMAMSSTAVGWKRFRRRHADAIIATIILGPMLLWWGVMYGIPIIFSFVLGFYEWIGINDRPKFVGFHNFVLFFQDKTYVADLMRSIWMGGLVTLLSIIAGLGAALLMNLPLFGKGIYRTLWYVPVVTSTIATTQVLNILLNPVNGAVNQAIEAMGFEPILWQSSVFWSIVQICVYSVWKGVGTQALLWLAGLQSIDPVLYEAAEIDGAGRTGKFINVTLPGIKPIATYIVITGLIAAIQIYEQVAFLTNGGPYGSTQVLVYRIIADGFFNFNLGMAGASSVILATIVFIASAAYYKLAQDKD